MRILICGNRNWIGRARLAEVMRSLLTVHGKFTVIEGGAQGADRMAAEWAKSHDLPVESYPANWGRHGRAAGPIRNREMLQLGKPDLVIAFHDPVNDGRGTLHMLALAKDKGVPIRMFSMHGEVDPPEW